MALLKLAVLTALLIPFLYIAESQTAHAANDEPSMGSNSVVRNTPVDGVRLGDNIHDAVSTLRDHGYKLGRNQETCLNHADYSTNPCLRKDYGVIIEMSRGNIKEVISRLRVRHVEGIVYELIKNTSYTQPSDASVASLEKQYKEIFSGSYSRLRKRGSLIELEFIDGEPPAQEGDFVGPYAKVSLGQGRGGLTESVHLVWQDLVGVEGLVWWQPRKQ